MFNFKPSDKLSESQIQKGLNLVIKDGVSAEIMTTLTGGAFLVAMALKLGASNFEIGLLAALPTFTNIFQLLTVWMVQKFNNRRAIALFGNILARMPLLIIGTLPFLFSSTTSIQVLIFLLFFHYLFGSIAGPGWNSWMKDLIPEKILGTYFSHRTRITQTVNVSLSLLLALLLDFVKTHYPTEELMTYSILFITGGVFGIAGTYFLSRTPEPKSYLEKSNIFKLFWKPLKDKNYRKLIFFNAFWSFALNLATPFFSVFMLKTIGLPLSYVIGLGILSQVSSIFSVKFWGKNSDKLSNKTIIRITAPLYIACIFSWTFAAMPDHKSLCLLILILISIVTGAATSGINLSLGNIAIKLASKKEAVVYLSAKNIIVAFISALGPLTGGLLADFFAKHTFVWNVEWTGPHGHSMLRLLSLQNWNFLFVIGGALALLSLQLLRKVKEEGEIDRDKAVNDIKTSLKTSLKESSTRIRLQTLFMSKQS